MKRRIQLKSWLCASTLLGAFAFTHAAQAADSGSAAAAPPPSSPKAEPTSVKRSAEEISPLPLAPRLLRLQLTPPKELPSAQHFRHEILWLGMRIPTLIAFGLSSVSAGGAVVTGYAATRGNDPSTCDTSCTEHGVRQRALFITTGVLTGMAAAGLGIGITFMLKEPRDLKAHAIRPRFDLGVSGEKAVAKVGWVFSAF
jgi:hypothetical protein